MDPILPDDKNTAAQEDSAVAPASLSAKGASRRRFGLGASGVILTLASKPGMAGGTGTMYCGTVSGWHSAGVASRAITNGSCQGVSAGYWSQDHHNWPSNCARTALFSSVFPEGKGTAYTDCSLNDVVCGHSSDKWNLRREFVAAYLNYMSGRNAHPNKLELQAMWTNYMNNGEIYRVASTGELLTGDKLKEFLANSHE